MGRGEVGRNGEVGTNGELARGRDGKGAIWQWGEMEKGQTAEAILQQSNNLIFTNLRILPNPSEDGYMLVNVYS
jgi:hypothetical protein